MYKSERLKRYADKIFLDSTEHTGSNLETCYGMLQQVLANVNGYVDDLEDFG